MIAMSLPTVETHEWEIPSYKLDAFKAKISQANKRLAQSGLDARFEISYADFEVKKNVAHVDHSVISNHAPVCVYEPWVRATLTGPLTLRHGHFTFVARLVPEEAGITVHSAPGQELSGYSPAGTMPAITARSSAAALGYTWYATTAMGPSSSSAIPALSSTPVSAQRDCGR